MPSAAVAPMAATRRMLVELGMVGSLVGRTGPGGWPESVVPHSDAR